MAAVRRLPPATPVNWKQGEDVIIAGSVSNDQARELFGEWAGAQALQSGSSPQPS